jgi:hypothetical protein
LSLEDGLLAGVIASCFTSVSCVLSAGTLSFLGVSVVVGPVIWDRNSYEISKKANVAFNAKLFFYSIPKSKFILTEDGKITDTIKDPIFDMDVVQPFDITWNKILENLWSSNDWNDLLSKVRRLAKSDPFFATLRDYIDNPEYPLPENTIT